jgi:hypothetical protein
LEGDGERGRLGEEDDVKSKSKSTPAIELFSEFKSHVEVASLDISCKEYYAYTKGVMTLAQVDVHVGGSRRNAYNNSNLNFIELYSFV